jgi:hypothetical protein
MQGDRQFAKKQQPSWRAWRRTRAILSPRQDRAWPQGDACTQVTKLIHFWRPLAANQVAP